jgi:light-regulated signal transduction histidine kinase (bacteriophytochrome)
MSNKITPAGGQPANLPAETSAKPAKRNTLAMSVHIPADWNPHTELLAIADYARNLVKRAERPVGNLGIEPSQVREINFMACLLAMRLSACTITINTEASAK